MCLAGVLSVWGLAGCQHEDDAAADALGLVPESKLGTRIGSVASVGVPQAAVVEGYGLVGGLAGTGSGDCPPAVREYLKRYILIQVRGRGYDVDTLIGSKDTAVVRLEGVLPPAARKDERFDVRVYLPSGSEATSLHGGWLYKAELMPAGRFGVAGNTVATVEGPMFVNTIEVSKPDAREGYILGGGRVADESRAALTLHRTDPLLISRIRNYLNERYGPGTADALSPTLVGLRIPVKYRQRRLRFVSMVALTYLEQTQELVDARVNRLVYQLARSEKKKQDSEIALEAIGRQGLTKVAALLDASEEEVRLRAARCMLYVGDDRGFGTLRNIALDPESQRRLEALDALAVGAPRDDVAALARLLLRDSDPAIVVGAYERLREMGDPAIMQERVGGGFYLEQVPQTDRTAIYVSRSGDPRVVLFGAPLTCQRNLFVESPDGMVIINSPAGQEHVSVIRRHPMRPGLIGPLNTSFDLADIIRTLGAEPGKAKDGSIAGLHVPYSDVIVLMQRLSAKGAVAAQFWAGPLPKSGRIIKK